VAPGNQLTKRITLFIYKLNEQIITTVDTRYLENEKRVLFQRQIKFSAGNAISPQLP